MIFQKCLFRSNYEVFLAKDQEFFNVGKLENMIRSVFSGKNRFYFFKSLPYKNGKAQNMPVVAGRLV